jgi:deoxyribodipyrimidine photo-lyase
MGFTESKDVFQAFIFNRPAIETYDKTRDFPALNSTSRVSVHLRFGTVSIRQLVVQAIETNATWLGELIWREFFMQILYHFPHVVHQPFKPKYQFIQWVNNEKNFEAWTHGQTGYPLVDAGMRELNASGFMHNRVRMVTASFLVKHLLINWQWGEAYFAEKLLDFELASNNGNWQWAAGTGCDAAPYFRIFNPVTQAEKFDPRNEYIKKWIPEFGTKSYVEPILEHTFARERCLETYKASL